MPKLKIRNDRTEFDAPQGISLPDLCDETGAGIPFSCRAASCGTCRIRVLENPSGLSPMDDIEREFIQDFIADAGPNERLACQCKLVGDVEVEIVEG